MRCPNCKNKVLQKSGKVTRLRTEGAHEFDENGVCHAKCYWCKSAIEVPIRVSKDAELTRETFVLRKA